MLFSPLVATSLARFSKSLTHNAQHTSLRSFLQSARRLEIRCQGQGQGNTVAPELFRSFTAFSGAHGQKTWLKEAKKWAKIAKQLSKARLSALVVSTTAVGFIAGSGDEIDWSRLCWASIGTFGASASANTLNQVYEVVNDAKMKRTMMRPLPLRRVSSPQALAFAAAAGIAGTAILAEKANGLTASLGVANIALYAGVYTPMKVVSATNTWVGAVVGAIPPLMGWTAASGSLEPGAAVLAAALYFWQIPHFLSLAWLHREDYMRGGYAMLSRYDLTGKRTASCALRNSLYMLPVGVFAVWVGTASWPFAYEAAIGAGTLATTAAIFYQRPTLKSARTLFRFSLAFLPAFMLGLVIHRLPNKHTITFSTLTDRVLQGLDFDVNRETSFPQSAEASSQKYPAIPIPFLPTPLQYRCPSKISCEGSEEKAEELKPWECSVQRQKH